MDNNFKTNKVEILVNRWQTPDGTILHSKHVHDYVAHHDKVTDDDYFIDGGNEYVRMSANKVPMKDLCLYTNSPFKEIRENYGRMAFNKETKSHYYILLKDMSDEHLINAIKYNYESGFSFLCKSNVQYLRELMYRNGLSVDNMY